MVVLILKLEQSAAQLITMGANLKWLLVLKEESPHHLVPSTDYCNGSACQFIVEDRRKWIAILFNISWTSLVKYQFPVVTVRCWSTRILSTVAVTNDTLVFDIYTVGLKQFLALLQTGEEVTAGGRAQSSPSEGL